MSRPVRVGNAHGFWGDRIEAAAEMLAAEPELDYITLDFLAEVSMSILALQRSRDPDAGWPRDFADVIQSLVPYWRSGGRCRLITNGGGLNPHACTRACRQILDAAGCGDRSIAVVSGDDVLEQLARATDETELFQNLDTGESLSRVQSRLVTANAYLGAQPVADALARGADIVITGRVADPSLTVAACAHFHGWKWDDWGRLAAATVAGHLIECGTQVTGGISTDWLEVPNIETIGFPIVEVGQDGGIVVTKPVGSGGRVCMHSVQEQLLYEIGDPGNYMSPDVTVSFLLLTLTDEGPDRVGIHGASGRPAPDSFKVSATFQDGFRAEGELTVYGSNAVAKARRAGQTVLQRLHDRGVTFRESLVECIGACACEPRQTDDSTVAELRETVLRLAVADDSRAAVERFSRELMPLITAGPPGTTGYAAGRPRVHPVFRYWPCLIDRNRITPQVALFAGSATEPVAPDSPDEAAIGSKAMSHSKGASADGASNGGSTPAAIVSGLAKTPRAIRLGDIALARSGDKGIHSNVGVIARCRDDYDRICREATVERVATHFGIDDVQRVTRYELPNLGALNFVIRGILANPLRTDAQGKALGQVLLELPLKTS